MRKRLLFSNKANRDRLWRERGGRRSSIRNQCIHPMYIEDQKQGLTAEDCGIGNTIYKTLFGVLYILEID